MTLSSKDIKRVLEKHGFVLSGVRPDAKEEATSSLSGLFMAKNTGSR